MSIISVAILIFLITDPFGNIAIFLAVLKNIPKEKRFKVIIRELLFALILLLFFLSLGHFLLAILGLSQESIGIAGGIILFVVAMRLIFPSNNSIVGNIPDGDPILVPLATPAIAGPSALAVLVTLKSTYQGPVWELYFALLIAWFATSLIVLQAGFLQKKLGISGLSAVERLSGMLLIMVSVNMLLDNLIKALNL